MEKGKRLKINKRRKVILNLIIYLLLFSMLIYSGIKIYEWYRDKEKNKEISEEIKDTIIVQNDKDEYTVDFNKLKEQNNETIAWINVNNTDIKYPIVKTKDNSFYLNHSFDKSENSAGWIFGDYRNLYDGTDKNIVIYGHNRIDGSMFGSLKNILDPDWYNNEENTSINFITEKEKSVYKVFSVYQIENEDYYIQTDFDENNKFKDFAEKIKGRSIKDFGIDVNEEDNILTLSTCGSSNKYRIVLHAKKVKGEVK